MNNSDSSDNVAPLANVLEPSCSSSSPKSDTIRQCKRHHPEFDAKIDENEDENENENENENEERIYSPSTNSNLTRQNVNSYDSAGFGHARDSSSTSGSAKSCRDLTDYLKYNKSLSRSNNGPYHSQNKRALYNESSSSSNAVISQRFVDLNHDNDDEDDDEDDKEANTAARSSTSAFSSANINEDPHGDESVHTISLSSSNSIVELTASSQENSQSNRRNARMTGATSDGFDLVEEEHENDATNTITNSHSSNYKRGALRSYVNLTTDDDEDDENDNFTDDQNDVQRNEPQRCHLLDLHGTYSLFKKKTYLPIFFFVETLLNISSRELVKKNGKKNGQTEQKFPINFFLEIRDEHSALSM